jgi:hypothetical protein
MTTVKKMTYWEQLIVCIGEKAGRTSKKFFNLFNSGNLQA